MPVPLSTSDEELMSRYQTGEFSAFEELYRRLAPRVYGYLSKRIVNVHDRDELLQTVFLKVHRARSTYEATLPLNQWLFTISRNAMTDYLRHRPQETTLEGMDPAAPDSQDSTPVNLLEHGSLSDRERSILSLRFWKDLSFDEIGMNLGLSSASARQIAHRAIVKLRSALQGGEN